MKTPATTKGISVAETLMHPATPIAAAPASPTAARTMSAVFERRVRSGRPFSSSSA
jgi:hypothetical protein